jgi:hypothetical protein
MTSDLTGGYSVEMVWFKTRKKKNLTLALSHILKRWRQVLRKYQKATSDLGYGWYYTEKTNFGFFLQACVQLGMYILLEFTEERKKRGEPSSLGRPDCWVLMNSEKWVDAYFEVKKDYGSIDTGPRRTVFIKLKEAQKQLKNLTESKSARARIALCFITLGRNVQSRTVISYERALTKYLIQLKENQEIDFYAAYLSPEKLLKTSNRRDNDTVFYPAIVMVGKFV